MIIWVLGLTYICTVYVPHTPTKARYTNRLKAVKDAVNVLRADKLTVIIYGGR